LADKYNVTVTNSFSILGSLPEDVETSWAAVCTTILDAARDTLPTVIKPKRPWLSTKTLAIIHKKGDARLRGSLDEWRRYKGIFKAKSKADLEVYYGHLADEAEESVRQHNLRCVFQTIRQIGKKPTCSSATVPVQHNDGHPCKSVDEQLEVKFAEQFKN